MILTRSKKLILNTIFSLTNQLVTILCGFILPRVFLETYGSAVYGLQESITQFLGFIALCDLGVGAVVQAALYKPLATKNEQEISAIICSSEKFFRKLAGLLVIYTIGLMIFYPLLIRHEFGWLYTASLILIISFSLFAMYFFGITYVLLLQADQMGFIQFGLHAVCLILNTVVSVILMKNGCGIHFVKLIASLFFIIQPVILVIYVRKQYHINHKIKLTTEPIKQKWNGLAQHVSSYILSGTDVLVLTIFSTLDNVSIYAIYNLIISGIKQLVYAMTSGVKATLGNMLALQEESTLNSFYAYFEWIMHTATTFLFGMTGLLILSFVRIYTAGIEDVNYIVPTFAFLFTFTQAAVCIRIPYTQMFLAAGHFKQTQTSSFIEAGLNLALSIVLVFKYGIIGVAIGTLVAVSYRTYYLAWYLSQNILKRKLSLFFKHLLVDLLVILIMLITAGSLQMESISYLAWVILACKTGVICLVVNIIINWLFYREEFLRLLHHITQLLCRIKKFYRNSLT